MEQNRGYRNKFTHFQTNDSRQRWQKLHWRKDYLFNRSYWELCVIYLLKKENRPLSLTQYKKVNSKWIKDLNVKPETLKLLEENMQETIWDIGAMIS
jgi:hypothetical protein